MDILKVADRLEQRVLEPGVGDVLAQGATHCGVLGNHVLNDELKVGVERL